MGFQTSYAGLMQHQQDEVDWAVREGLRRFYTPPLVMPGENRPHEWSFLTPRTTLSLVAGTSAYTLPDNFAYIVSPFTYAAGTAKQPIRAVTDEELRSKAAIVSSSGDPVIFSIVPVVGSSDSPNTTPDTPTRWQANFWPTPANAATVTYRYRAIMDALTTTINPPGGALFGQVIVASCLAVVEERLNHNRPRAESVMKERFIDGLRAAIGMDRRMSVPRMLGVMTDPSDGMDYGSTNVSVLYNGVQY